jgi:hypothetical protein
MTHSRITPRHQSKDFTLAAPEQEEDFLTPEQRLNAIADILSDMALEALRKQHAQDTSTTP